MQLLQPGVGLILWQLIVFLLLLFLLAKFAWKPIIGALKEREQSIQDSLETAERARMEMQQLKADNEQLLKETREERDKILREGRALANQLQDEAREEAKKSADQIISDARAVIQVEKQAALKEVKIQVANFSLEIAEKLIRKNLADDKNQKALVNDFLKELKIN